MSMDHMQSGFVLPALVIAQKLQPPQHPIQDLANGNTPRVQRRPRWGEILCIVIEQMTAKSTST